MDRPIISLRRHMSIQHIIGAVFLTAGIIYAIYIIRDVMADREAFRSQPGTLRSTMIAEAIVYFFCTIGISDFVMNTIVVRRLKLAGPETLPDNLITCGIVPGSFIAFLYLRNAPLVDVKTMLVFMGGLALGSFFGSRAVGKMKGEAIRKVLVILLIAAMAALIVRMILSAGEPGTATALTGGKLVLLGVLNLIFGFTNMLGIPAKPFVTTAMMLLGMSPLTTLTLLLGSVPISIVTGGINVVRRRRYNKKMVISAMTAGCVTAFIGTALAISINATVLNIILIAVIGVAVVSLLKK